MALDEGKKAPSFKGIMDDGSIFSSKDLKGFWTVLYFYPKDDTSSCTAEACSFRDSMKRIIKDNVRVIGVSPDTVKSHVKFKTKYELNYPLISDPDHSICEAFEVWKEKSMYGRKYMGVERTTYIIGPKSTIARTYEKVKVTGHVDAIVSALKGLIE
ncbi:MAG: peroxiredoxin [Candidatus Kapabacteria bacterium]|nr:peroxiredoxin [Candidatus Kapabacteria bacterium]